jgi:hypothetical protein
LSCLLNVVVVVCSVKSVFFKVLKGQVFFQFMF